MTQSSCQKSQKKSKKTWDDFKLGFKLDPWQIEVLNAKGNICLCSGRQVGKSQIIAIKAAHYIATNPDKQILIISITEDQSQRMLQKILLFLNDNYKSQISKGKDKPTKHKVHMKNGSEAVTKAVGQYGLGVLGMTVDIVVPDECAYLPEDIWAAITPMLLTTGGNMWLLSTPNLREGYFYEAYTNPDMNFKTFHVKSKEVAEGRPEPMRTMMLEHLQREKERMTKLQYAQQYLAQFLDELKNLFPESLVSSISTSERNENRIGEFYLGCDIARFGEDESTFEVFEKIGDKLYQRENIQTRKTYTTETTQKIIELDKKYKFKTIYIDDGGIGAAVFDQLLEKDTGRRTIPINNAARALDRDENRKKKILKENLYMNLLRLMESKRIKLLPDDSIKASLKSVMCETDKQGRTKIHGRYTHITEGIIRAAWSLKENKLTPKIF